MTTLQGKIALITGASRGLGRHAALTLASQGVQVALVARSASALAETAQLIHNQGGVAHTFPTDLSNLASIDDLRQQVTEQLGVPSILINAAVCSAWGGGASSMSPRRLRWMVRVA